MEGGGVPTISFSKQSHFYPFKNPCLFGEVREILDGFDKVRIRILKLQRCGSLFDRRRYYSKQFVTSRGVSNMTSKLLNDREK